MARRTGKPAIQYGASLPFSCPPMSPSCCQSLHVFTCVPAEPLAPPPSYPKPPHGKCVKWQRPRCANHKRCKGERLGGVTCAGLLILIGQSWPGATATRCSRANTGPGPLLTAQWRQKLEWLQGWLLLPWALPGQPWPQLGEGTRQRKWFGLQEPSRGGWFAQESAHGLLSRSQ